MRFYTFTNMYLSPIQCGIQSAHCLAEIYLKYKDNLIDGPLDEWALDHKTIIVLNGGTDENLHELRRLFEKDSCFPWAYFREPALGNTLTCVGIIVPMFIYDMSADRIADPTLDLSAWEVNLIQTLARHSLAR